MEKVIESPIDMSKAIARVLLAEEQAREAVARCKREAERLVEDARGTAQAISYRADARIASARSVLAVRVSAELARLEVEGAALEAGPGGGGDPDRQAAAVAALAAELAGEPR